MPLKLADALTNVWAVFPGMRWFAWEHLRQLVMLKGATKLHFCRIISVQIHTRDWEGLGFSQRLTRCSRMLGPVRLPIT